MGSTTADSNGATIYPVETRCFINNEFVNGKDTFDIFNPATDELSAKVHQADEELVNAAVDAAEAAFPAWAALDASARAQCLFKLADLMVKNADELSYLEAISMGKVTAYYSMEVQWTADFYRYFAGLATEIHGETSLSTSDLIGMVLRQPYGVCAAIIPWNGPLAAMCLKVGPALAAGNTLVLKPSEKSPLTAICMGKLIMEAGFPPGVLNIVPGLGHITGSALARHMRVRKLAFTGSARTGRLIKKMAAESNLKNVTLELGGKSPCIIFGDADLDAAVSAAAFSIAQNSGQVCMASSRVYVEESISERFVDAYISKFKEFMGKAGDTLDPTTTHAPQADAAQLKSIMGFIEDAKAQGINPISGGSRIGKSGNFLEPTVYLNPSNNSKINQEEVFGPVAVIHTFKDEDEVLKLANATEYGLYASIFTKDIGRAMKFAKALDSGMVGVNCTSPTSPFDMPFGGVKQSGDGREFSLQSLHSWTESKTVMIKL